MTLKPTKTLRTHEGHFQPQMPKLKFLKTLIFLRAPSSSIKLVNFIIFSYLKLFSTIVSCKFGDTS